MKKRASHLIQVGTITKVFITNILKCNEEEKGALCWSSDAMVGQWRNSGETEAEEKSNQGPWIPVSAFASYGTVNWTLPQPLKIMSPINRTCNLLLQSCSGTYGSHLDDLELSILRLLCHGAFKLCTHMCYSPDKFLFLS